MPNFTYFNTLFLFVWLQVINKVKFIHQGEGHIKVKVKYLQSFKFYVAHALRKQVVCFRLNAFLFRDCFVAKLPLGCADSNSKRKQNLTYYVYTEWMLQRQRNHWRLEWVNPYTLFNCNWVFHHTFLHVWTRKAIPQPELKLFTMASSGNISN